MDLIFTLIFIIFLFFVFLEPFLAYKEMSLFECKDGKFLGWEDFFPRVIKKFIVEIFGHVGFFQW